MRYPTKDGIVMKLDPFQYIDNIILNDGYYEPNVLNAIIGSLRSGDTFWDIGSNLGLHALTVKRKMPSVTVIAFEPNPKMHALIMEARESNDLDIKAFNQGLSDRTAEVDFFVNPENSGGGGADEDPNRPGVEKIRAFFSRGDNFIAEGKAPAPNVLKIDVEGHEYEVCLGLTEHLASHRLRTIIFEDKEADNTPVKKLIAEKGFSIRLLERAQFALITSWLRDLETKGVSGSP
jgi:FkbM family methyltransferase